MKLPPEDFGSRQHPELCLHTATSSYVIFGAVLGGLMVFLGIVALETPSFWIAVGVCGVCLVGILSYLSRLEIRLSNDVLTYRTLFKSQSMPLAKVVESSVRWNMASGDHRLLLVVASLQETEPMTINLKPFRPDDIVQLLELPALRVHSADDVA